MLGAAAGSYLRKTASRGSSSSFKSSGSSKSSGWGAGGPRTGNENYGMVREEPESIDIAPSKETIARTVATLERYLSGLHFNQHLPVRIYKHYQLPIFNLVSYDPVLTYEVGFGYVTKLATYATEKERDADILSEMRERDVERTKLPRTKGDYMFPYKYTLDEAGTIEYVPDNSSSRGCCRRGKNKSSCALMGGRRRRSRKMRSTKRRR